ncbi:MAG TPA: type II secretion system protein GspL [Steroidobacteraceae bacterium]|nr:type II secretion system protein GspL [Steroidobacteraceae bacterium]
MESLVIRLPEAADAPASWLIVDATGARLSAVQTGPLNLAAPLAAGKRVVVLVPGVDVLLAEPELPVRGSAKLAQVVPFALEESLAEDVDELHFAIGRREGTRTGTPVAAVSHARLRGWLERLGAAQISPDLVSADTDALPRLPGQTVVLIDADRLYVRREEAPPAVVHAEPLADTLELTVLDATPTETHLLVYLTPGDWTQHQDAIDGLRARVATLKVQLLPDGVVPWLAHHAVTAAPLNLLQGPYAPKSHWGAQWSAWRVAAILAAALVALNLLGKGVEIWHLSSVEKQLDASIERVFREAMPGEQNAVDARRRMEARLQAIRGGPGGDSLLAALGTLGGAVAQVPETKLEALSFRGSVLDLKVTAKDVGSLDRLQRLVTERGMPAELQSSNPRPPGVEGRIQVRGQGAS